MIPVAGASRFQAQNMLASQLNLTLKATKER